MKKTDFRLKIKSEHPALSDLVIDRFDDGVVQINLIHTNRFDAITLNPDQVQELIKHLSVTATQPFRG
jgi:hypothetical protein